MAEVGRPGSGAESDGEVGLVMTEEPAAGAAVVAPPEPAPAVGAAVPEPNPAAATSTIGGGGWDPDALYCVCRTKYDHASFMIECDACHDWFHGRCVGITQTQSAFIKRFHCFGCRSTHGPLQWKNLRKRRKLYRPDEPGGEFPDLVDQPITREPIDFVSRLKDRQFLGAEKCVTKLSGEELSRGYFEEHGFTQPLLCTSKEALGLRVPEDSFQISDVVQAVGRHFPLSVIDVATQLSLPDWTLGDWGQYFATASKQRAATFNVISLEFSKTDMAPLVSPPSIVRQIDWVSGWPDDAPGRPSVEKYCLMGVAESYTDFHIDFAGSSVWYHVVWGRKVFYFIEPTQPNLAAYETWSTSHDQSHMFFGDYVDKCYRAVIDPGQTMLIPAGWIHAVYTPKDTLVFGGNYVHDFGVKLQLRVTNMENKLRVPTKFRFPSIERLTWYAADRISRRYRDGVVPNCLQTGIVALQKMLCRKVQALEKHEAQIPPEIRANEVATSFKAVVIDRLTHIARVIALASPRKRRHARGGAEPSSPWWKAEAKASAIASGMGAVEHHVSTSAASFVDPITSGTTTPAEDAATAAAQGVGVRIRLPEPIRVKLSVEPGPKTAPLTVKLPDPITVRLPGASQSPHRPQQTQQPQQPLKRRRKTKKGVKRKRNPQDPDEPDSEEGGGDDGAEPSATLVDGPRRRRTTLYRDDLGEDVLRELDEIVDAAEEARARQQDSDFELSDQDVAYNAADFAVVEEPPPHAARPLLFNPPPKPTPKPIPAPKGVPKRPPPAKKAVKASKPKGSAKSRLLKRLKAARR